MLCVLCRYQTREKNETGYGPSPLKGKTAFRTTFHHYSEAQTPAFSGTLKSDILCDQWWGPNEAILCLRLCSAALFRVSNLLLMVFNNAKPQEIQNCVMCSHSPEQFLPVTALSNYVFKSWANIFQLSYR